jgi:hypothetical protein
VTACPDDNELTQLVDGSIADAARARIERHLDACRTCTRLVGELAWVVAPPRDAPPGYRLGRAIDAATWEAEHGDRRVSIGFAPHVDARLGSVRHPNVIAVHVIGTLGDEQFVVTELVRTTVRDTRATLAVWQQALAGLAALHRASIVHGAFSPDAVFVDGARVLVGGFANAPSRTAGYLAPEQLENRPATARSDQFSACVALYEALANKKPFTGATPGALAVAMSSPPEPPAELDRRLYTVLARGLAADPAKRWPDVEALAAALARPRRPRAPFVAAGVALVATAIAVALLAR